MQVCSMQIYANYLQNAPLQIHQYTGCDFNHNLLKCKHLEIQVKSHRQTYANNIHNRWKVNISATDV